VYMSAGSTKLFSFTWTSLNCIWDEVGLIDWVGSKCVP